MAPDRLYGTSAPVVKAGRADAQRNRRRVLETADEVFAVEGMGVPIDEIARRAGVGPGTLYRHFPTKEALFMAVAVNRIKASIDEAHRLAKEDDPSVALFAYLRGLGAQFQSRKDLIEVMAAGGRSVHDAEPRLAQELKNAIGTLLAKAQAARSVRNDVTVDDVMNLVVGVYSATAQVGRQTEVANRLLSVVFDGLRPRATTKESTRRSRSHQG